MIFGILKPYPSPLITGRGIDLDFPLLAGCLALLGLGLVMITSASSEVAALQSGNTLYHMIRHLFYIVLGLGACVLTMMVPIATWQRMGWMLLLGAFGLLVMVLLPGIGREVNGSMRWIGFSFFNVQPSEVAKVFVVIYLAGYLVRQQKEVRESWMGFFKPFIVLLPMAGLLLMEPDFGATVVMMGAAAAMPFKDLLGLFIGQLKKRAETTAGRDFEEVVLGRPVFFVDDDPLADQDRREHRDRHQQAQRGTWIDQRVQAHRREYREVQHRDPGALQHQAVVAVAQAQPPTQAQQGDGSGGDAGVAQFNRHHHAFGGITQQERQAEEQQHHADPQHGVAAEQPIARTADGAFDQVGATGDCRFFFRA